MKSKIEKILNSIEHSFEWIDSAAMIAMWIIALIELFFRDVVNSPLSWSLDVTLLIMVWMAMMGSGVGVRSDLHIKISFFTSKIPLWLEKIFGLISYALVFYFGIYMFVGSYSLAILPGIIPSLGISNSWSYIPIMIGGIFAMMFSFEKGIRLILKGGKKS
jgi:TRAP-type C4-dicarboxylate transport system permease small subunit